MDNYCTQCGNPLNGKYKCEKCGNINGGTFNVISDKVKNYDYRTEAENIKKGGIKYFWNKHRKLSLCVLCFVIVLCVSLCFGNNNEKTKKLPKTDTKTYSDTTATPSRKALEKEAISVYEDVNGIGSAERDGFSAALKDLSDSELRMILGR